MKTISFIRNVSQASINVANNVNIAAGTREIFFYNREAFSNAGVGQLETLFRDGAIQIEDVNGGIISGIEARRIVNRIQNDIRAYNVDTPEERIAWNKLAGSYLNDVVTLFMISNEGTIADYQFIAEFMHIVSTGNPQLAWNLLDDLQPSGIWITPRINALKGFIDSYKAV